MKHKGALRHPQANGNPGICYRFQRKQRTDPAKCGREHVCIGCARPGVPYNDCLCLEAKYLATSPAELRGACAALSPVAGNLSSPVRVLLVSVFGGHRDEISQGWSDLQSSLISPLPLELIHVFFDPPEAAQLPILDLLDRVRGYFQVVCVLPPNETWTKSVRVKKLSLRVGRSGT